MDNKNPIGIIDSGVGGLTVVKELQILLPHEDIIYLGDNKNVPYGSKSRDEIVNLTKNLLNFLIDKDVKLVGIGCNTISTVLKDIVPDYGIKILGIIDPVVGHLAQGEEKTIGLIATPFTVSTKYYEQMLNSLNKNIKVSSEGCPNLAAFIDKGQFTLEEVSKETYCHLTQMEKADLKTIVLGCTHYPIITDYLNKLYPGYTFINPALFQAMAIRDYLQQENLLNTSNANGEVEIFTTGEISRYREFLDLLSIKNIGSINQA
ncbi:MAG: glutamate racemase [Bacillota bacterium]